MDINIVDWSYGFDGEVIIVEVKDDRGVYYKGSLELVEMCSCGKAPVEGMESHCTRCLNTADLEQAAHEGE